MRRPNGHFFLLFTVLAGLLGAAPSEAQVGGRFRLLASRLAEARYYHTATLLNDGRVLLVGGIGATTAASSSAELFDPATETFSLTGSLATRRYLHTATLLPSGDVLIVGGSSNPGVLTSAEIYRVATGTFEPGPVLRIPRAGHTATLLHDGTVLIAGGTATAAAQATVEVYDPVAGAFSLIESMPTPRSGHEAALLPNGKVLVTGGSTDRNAPLFDPVTRTWTNGGALWTARLLHTATLDGSGHVFVYGGEQPGQSGTPLITDEAFSLGTERFVGPPDHARLLLARSEHSATPLADGAILFIGGNFHSPYAGMAESYDAARGVQRVAGFLNQLRSAHTATLLPSGQVLIAGGHGPDPGALNTAETYPGTGSDPALLAQIASLNDQIAQMQEQVTGLTSERTALLAEIARLRQENDDLRRQLANLGAPTGTGAMSGSGLLIASRTRNSFEFSVAKSPDGNLKLALSFKVCEQLPEQPDDDLTCYSRLHRLSVAYFTAVHFSDDPSFAPSPDPSKQGVDTLVLSGVASWDDVEGYRFTVTATDRGDEEGPNVDTFEIVITNPDGNVVMSVFGTLAAGNVETR